MRRVIEPQEALQLPADELLSIANRHQHPNRGAEILVLLHRGSRAPRKERHQNRVACNDVEDDGGSDGKQKRGRHRELTTSSPALGAPPNWWG